MLVQLAHEPSCHSDRDRGYAWARDHELPLPKGCLGYQHCWVLISSQYGTNTSPQHGTVPWMDQPSTRCQVDFIAALPSSRGDDSSLLEYNYFLNRDLLSLPVILLFILPLLTPRMLHPPSWGPARMAPCQGTHFVTKEERQWAHSHGINWSYHRSHCLEVGGLIER